MNEQIKTAGRKPQLIIKKLFKDNAYTPDKKELCDLIMRDLVTVCITSQARYEGGLEVMTIKINHS